MASAAVAQSTKYKWHLLPRSPLASSRTDDIWFFDELTGWLVNSSGYVCKTEDGGSFWERKFFLYPDLPSKPYLRCMSWANRQIGWFGAVTGVGGRDLESPPITSPSQYIRTLLHQTTDGGETWHAVQNLPENSPGGICGFHAVNESVAYGAGTNDPGLPGPAIIKTVDNGASWELISMQEYADNLIDIFFFDERNGFVVGGKNRKECPVSTQSAPVTGYEPPRFSRYAQLKPVVLRTSDGGKTWIDTAADTSGFVCGEWGWKIQFLNKQIGFVALENFVDAAILTTIDGGASWTRKHVAANQEPGSPALNNDLEGIGFVNERQGWVGGWGYNFKGLMNSYTEDGGETWVREDHLPGDPNSDPRTRINRYRLFRNLKGEMRGFCCGQQVFTLQGPAPKKGALAKKTALAAALQPRMEPAHSGEVSARTAVSRTVAQTELDHGFELRQMPSNDGAVEISYTLPEDSQNVFLGLWNKFAFHIRTLVSEKAQTRGRRTVVWDGKDDAGNPAGPGVFICRMCTAGEKGASQMIQLQQAY